MIDSVVQWIVNLGLGYTNGVNIFSGFIPPKRSDETEVPDRILLVADSASSAVYFDVRDRVDFLVQFLNRSRNKAECYSDAKTIFDRIHGINGINLPDRDEGSGRLYVSMTIEANQAPQYVGQDEKRRFQYSTNYIFRIRNG